MMVNDEAICSATIRWTSSVAGHLLAKIEVYEYGSHIRADTSVGSLRREKWQQEQQQQRNNELQPWL